MSLDSRTSDSPPILSVDGLVAYFHSAGKPAAEHMLGLEHEKLLVDTRTWGPVPYEGPRGIQGVLAALQTDGFTPFREAEGLPVIALQRGMRTVSLEPGGQLELSGTATKTARAAHEENRAHLQALSRAAASLELLPVAMGYRPLGVPSEMPWMPKTRYRAMRETLGKRGSMSLDMMLMTATGQISLDWTDEADCSLKVSVATRSAPLLVALYANSPIVKGRASGMLSYRSHVWTDVDPARCGVPDFFLDGRFSFVRYLEWALDAPLLFLRRGGEYLTPSLTFRQLVERGFEGEPARQSDWVDHLSTLFPEVRIKRVLEIRSADCVDEAGTGGLAALYRGLFYDAQALAEADAMLPRFTPGALARWMVAAREQGLRATVDGESLAQKTVEWLSIARRGLERLDPLDVPLLAPLEAQARSGVSPAERLLRTWEKSPTPEALYRTAALS